MRTIVTFLALMTLVGCYGCGKSEEPIAFSKEVYPFTNPNMPAQGKRLIFIHGINGTHEDLLKFGEYKFVIDTMINNGWQVITFDLPKTRKNQFDDGGISYRLKYEARLADVIAWSEANVGHCNVNIIGGVSFGGLHALMGAQMNTIFNGYFADVPVTRVEALQFHEAPSFTPFANPERLRPLPGYIAYGGKDVIVNYKYTIDLITAINPADITIAPVPNMGHEIHDLSGLTHWLLSRF